MRNAAREPRGENPKERARNGERNFLPVTGGWGNHSGRHSAVASSSVIDEPTLRRGHGYGNALAGRYGTFSSTSSLESWLRNDALWEETRWYASPGYESETRRTTSTIEPDKQLTLWGSTVSSSRPRPFDVPARAVSCYLRSKKDFKQSLDPAFSSPSAYDLIPVGPETELCSLRVRTIRERESGGI